MGTNEAIDFGAPRDMVGEEDHVELVAKHGDQPIRCRISREALEELASMADATATERLRVAQAHFDDLTDKWGYLISVGRFEPDGSVLLRTNDVRT